MSDRIDEFESRFKSADKPALAYQPVSFHTVLLVSDRDAAATERLAERVRRFLSVLDNDHPTWPMISGDAYRTVDDLLHRVDDHRPDLIVAPRHLHDSDRRPRFSLGTYLDELTQSTSVPVLVLPCDDDSTPLALPAGTHTVMVVTDHLTGDGKLVCYGARLTDSQGTLVLAHIEDDRTYSNYMRAIEKIPEIDSDVVREQLREQLLSEPADYIRSCAEVLRDAGHKIGIENVVRLGHHITDYRKLIGERSVDLLAFHTRKESQLAMSGMAYLITTEFRHIPLLLL